MTSETLKLCPCKMYQNPLDTFNPYSISQYRHSYSDDARLCNFYPALQSYFSNNLKSKAKHLLSAFKNCPSVYQAADLHTILGIYSLPFKRCSARKTRVSNTEFSVSILLFPSPLNAHGILCTRLQTRQSKVLFKRL